MAEREGKREIAIVASYAQQILIQTMQHMPPGL
jgi:hypothetical protein